MSRNNDTRREEIRKILLRQDSVKVTDLAETLKVTPETIRGDLTFLEEKGFLYRNRGTASLRMNGAESPMELRMREYTDAKKAISEAAFEMIKDDMILYFSASSTLLYLCKLLTLRKNLTVVTNSIDMISILAGGRSKIIVLGGEYLRTGRRTYGDDAVRQVSSICFDIGFLGMDGCLNCDGPATVSTDERAIDLTVMSRASMNVLASDRTKFAMASHYQYAKFTDFDYVLTDTLDSETKEKLNLKNLKEVSI
ncbi:MAG: DeoR/GlpR family DNA-binding transcription regulator [Solobacterium sp.]|jgi:DeoR/GlpR family transcriptional regulator of sugar metabolism|nr:DeoR/GlpR family DNA-binding transcription regulator [Solobacterium sp.]MCH4265830.1 DeoR/GlpR family DNA-binding transcription regulator [Solobacterium sp.]